MPQPWGTDGSLGFPLEVGQLGVSVGYRKGINGTVVAEVVFDEGLHDDPIIDEHGIAPGTQTKAEVGAVDEHAHLAGEFAIAIGYQQDIAGAW